MTDLLRLEEAVVRGLAAARPKRGRAAEGTLLLKPLARDLGSSEGDIEQALRNQAALEVRDVQATRLFGIFRRTRPARGVALRPLEDVVQALDEGAAPARSDGLLARCVAALAAADPPVPAAEFAGVLPGAGRAARSLSPLTLQGAQREDVSSAEAGADASRTRSQVARLRKVAPGGGMEFSERARANTPMAALEALLQAPPALLAKTLKGEDFERWLRDDCKERELADLATATRLRGEADRLAPEAQKRLFVRLLSFSPLREAIAGGIVPSFVARLTSAPADEVVEIVATLEGLGTESVLEALVKAVYEVPPDSRPRVLMAMGAVGSPRVLEPLQRLALHSKVKADRLEAAAAITRIAGRFPGPAAASALKALEGSADPEVKAMLPARA